MSRIRKDKTQFRQYQDLKVGDFVALEYTSSHSTNIVQNGNGYKPHCCEIISLYEARNLFWVRSTGGSFFVSSQASEVQICTGNQSLTDEDSITVWKNPGQNPEKVNGVSIE